MKECRAYMKIGCKILWGLLLSFNFAIASQCKPALQASEALTLSSVRPVAFTSSSKAENEKTFLQLVEQTGLNPKVPDLRRIRDASKFSLVVPAQLGTEA